MATTPIILSTGSSSGAGTPGQGRKDLVIGETVTCSDTEPANVGASYVWSFIDIPIGSSTVINSPNTATPNFVPDVTGTYRLQAVVNGVFSSQEGLAVSLPATGSRIPSFEERLEYDGGGNTKGWHEAMTDFMRQVDTLLGGGGTTDIFYPPEVWGQEDVPANQPATQMGANLSQLYDDFQVVRGGSVVGLNIRFNANVTSGTATARVAINGVVQTLQVTVTAGQSSARATQAPGVDVLSPGDRVSVFLQTSAGYGPATLDAEASVEIQRSGFGNADIYAVPDIWTQVDVPASQPQTAMFANNSQLFDDFQVVRSGSIVGINLRFNANVAAGNAIATVTKNGTPVTLNVTVSSGSSSGRATQATGIDTVVPGDRIGVVLQTDGSFSPTTLDADAWVEIQKN